MVKLHTIESEKFGIIDGQVVYLFRLVNNERTSVEIISYGATIKSINIPDKKGRIKNIILGYDRLEDYLSDKNYLGATIGRCANRISNASFVMDGRSYSLDKNDGPNCNHGGFSGFHKKLFDHKIENDKLILSAESEDGEGGFPGNITLTVSYQLTDKNDLFMGYHVSTDQKTPVNVTNHAYFNLSGRETILDHQLKIESDRVLESDNNFLPTGAYLNVKNNPGFDFREFKVIGENMSLKKEKIKGYNSYFISRRNENERNLKRLAILKSGDSDIRVEVFSTMPGVMIYTGDYLSGSYQSLSGVCLEAHYYPDSPNRPHFSQGIYAEGDTWRETIMYRIVCPSEYL
ncbi:aldose epimerase family protein [Proteiniphilum acetatigenes]|uniref:aldose epimerase family protein n=1 Tax=Proteiniphilum acetatigenes TaxID=294710 RepID=UPI00036BB045|nr:aldose epimerase family protein [Proteiniphilum acetatigenes]